MFKSLIIACLVLPLSTLYAHSTNPQELQADKTIQQLYHNQCRKLKTDLPNRIDIISAQFIGKPYLRGALGEGTQGYYDNHPLYRVDAFDCETYVDTVLALAFANNLSSFNQYIRSIRYKNGHVSFIHRNHFTCLDWNQNNQKQKLIKDITLSFVTKQGKPVAQTATALINKPAWYQHFSTDIIHTDTTSKTELAKRLIRLKRAGNQLPKTYSKTPYIPLTALFNQHGQANLYLFDQIPNGAIIEIVRPNWDIEQQIGTRLNISHLGFAIRKKGRLLFRAATSSNNQVMDVSLIDYLREAQKSPTIKGINVEIVLGF